MLKVYDWKTIAEDDKDSFWCGVCETIWTRENLIDYILNGEWHNYDWDKDDTMRIQIGLEDDGYAMDGRLCLNRDTDRGDFWIWVQIDKYSVEEGWHWGACNTDDEDNFVVGGELKDIEDEITQEVYDSIAPNMMEYVKKAYYKV